jgi:hypothetical protein
MTSTKVTTKSTRKKKVVAEPSTFRSTHKWANCAECGVNLKKWGLGATDGATCPPCVEIIRREDMEKRAGSTKVLFVPVEGEVEVTDWTHAFRKMGVKYVAHVSHLPDVAKGTRPLYEMFEATFTGGLPENDRARRIAGKMGIFCAEWVYRGPVIITGPCSSGLLDREIARYEKA